MAMECASKREHGYKRIVLPLQSCDVIAQICPPSFPPCTDTALSPEIILPPFEINEFGAM